MKNLKFHYVVILILTFALATQLAAQVQTEVPPLVPGAKTVTVEHIKIHGTALEGNLEGNDVNRDVQPGRPTRRIHHSILTCR
jgi:hypothetical protein